MKSISISDTVSETVQRQRDFFASGATRPYAHRLNALRALQSALVTHSPALLEAVNQDLGKPAAEAYTSEIAVVQHELAYTMKHLKRWMRPKRVPTPMHLQPARSRIYPEPLGVALIIGPWNYPVQLTLNPLLGALAAGNCAVVKPSELAPHTSAVVAKMLGSAFAPELVSVVKGGVEPTTELLAQRFDHIFFTGSTSVGKIVYQAAAKHLTPVILELGGKSPALVAADADLKLAARRIMWGKFMNAGQTCVAPDYIYVDQKIVERLVVEMKSALEEFYGPDPKSSPDYGRIVNARNFARLEKLMAAGTTTVGGGTDKAALYIAPTLLRGIEWCDPIMQEEIFGPLLPILTYAKLDDALAEIRRHDKPLSAYLFSNDSATQKQFIESFSFGGGCINDTVLHLANGHLPFGGVGASGLGAYHGERSFQIFSHLKSVLHKSRFMDVWLRYPPFKGRKLEMLKALFGISRALD